MTHGRAGSVPGAAAGSVVQARRSLPGPLAAAVIAGLGLLGWASAPALAAPAATTPTTVPAATVPAGQPAPTVVPPIPAVPPAITNNEDPNALLQRAIALSSVGASQAPLEASLAQAQQVLDAQSVVANHASAAAALATQRATDADATAATATATAGDLQGALREAALRLYTGGAMSVVPTDLGTNADLITDAAAYEETILSPNGILQQRKAQAKVARDAAEEKRKELATAVHEEAVATAALAAATTAADQIHQKLAVLGTTTATLVASERSAVSAQAGQSLATPAPLEFVPAAPLPPPVATTSVALAWAFSELGRTYVWGGTGPDVFDCSGLTQYSWARAGVDIPRVAADQDAWTVPVPLSQLLPGDLVFFGTTDIHHVGMYIGDGLMINAPHTGDVVRVSPMWWSDLAGFGRVHAAGVPVPARVLPADTHPAIPAVLASVGAVPSQSTPPPGYVAPPGATAPVAPPTTVAGPPDTTLPGAPGSGSGGSGTGSGSPGGGSGSSSGAPTTTLPGSTTTVPGATTTTTAPTTVPSPPTTTLGVLGIGG